MSGARLTSIDAVQEMAAALETFRNEASAALDELDMQIRRALEWIHHERHDFWEHQVRRGWERVSETRIELQQAMTARRVADHEPSCYDEKKAVARAKQRLDIALEKVEKVRHWGRAIDHAVDEYRGARTEITSWLDAEAPKARATLERLTDTLETYVTTAAAPGLTGKWAPQLPPGVELTATDATAATAATPAAPPAEQAAPAPASAPAADGQSPDQPEVPS